MVSLVHLSTIPSTDIETLLDLAFGPDRHLRTAYKIRAETAFDIVLSFAAVETDQLIGLIQCWSVALDLDEGGAAPLAMVGPVAVLPARQRDGIGRLLMTHMLAVAAETGQDRALMLIGDPEYYGRFFGFSADRTAAWRVPGPVEQHRLLARGPDVPAASGMLGPRVVATA